MKYYVIKITATAKANNPSFAGCITHHYYGKNQSLIGGDDFEGTYCKQCGVHPMDSYLVKEYGYTRLCDAKRSWIYNNPINEPYWVETTEIIEVEV